MPDQPIATTEPRPPSPDGSPPEDLAPPRAAAPLRGARAVRVTAIVALVGVLLALLGLGIGALPLQTQTQDCGTAASFLLDGRLNQLVDPANPPKAVTAAEAKANNAKPCQERAANRAWPAGILVVGGTLLALVALVVEVTIRVIVGRRLTTATAVAPPGPATA